MTTIGLDEDWVEAVLITAFDGGLGGCWYWAEPDGDDWLITEDNKWSEVLIADRIDPDKKFAVNVELLAEGIKAMNQKQEYYRSNIQRLVTSEFDAGDVDLLVQYACFGEVVYG